MAGPNPTDPNDSIPSHLVIPFLAMTADKCRLLAERGAEVIPLLGQGKSGRMLKSRFMTPLGASTKSPTVAVTVTLQRTFRAMWGQLRPPLTSIR